MDKNICTITLADGIAIKNLTMNGNNYISKAAINPDCFKGNCSPVVISDGAHDEMHDNMALVQVTKVGDEYWFVLRDISSNELAQIKLQSDIEYVAMMSGVDL